MKVSIVGTGYVGLVSGACLAEKGHDVVCVDIDKGKVDRINRGDPPFHEPHIQDLLRRNLTRRFRATTDLRQAVLDTELSMIAVGTPFSGDEIDLRFINEVATQIGEVLKDKSAYHVVVVKSTVVPGTTDEIVTPLLQEASGKEVGAGFGVGMNPEFLREGEAVQDFLFPDRIILGGIDDRALDMLEKLYQPFDGVDILRTNPRTAETIKYTANSLLATMISFSNEIGNLCSTIEDVDVLDVMRGVHLDKRLSPFLPNGERIKPAFTTYLEAGCGFGGSCFPKDVKALISYAKKVGSPMRILKAVMGVNIAQPRKVLALLQKHFPVLDGVRISILGLAFKPGTDDMRESPAIPIVKEILAQNAVVKAFDPVARKEAEKIFGDNTLTFASTLPEAIGGAEAVVLLTRWPEFQELPRLFSTLPEQPVLIDGRRMLEKCRFPRYEGIGLSSSEGQILPVRRRHRLKETLALIFSSHSDVLYWASDFAACCV
jgi:UDPglucose 6-dehydrogenase/GDP-mannose 6-dehydrogenase